jgi:hypothetical protein
VSADHICRLHTCAAAHESPEATSVRNQLLDALFRQGTPRDLKRGELGALLPARAPQGCGQNKERGRVIQLLNRKGYTCQGRRCS